MPQRIPGTQVVAASDSPDRMPAIVQKYMDKVNAKIGTNYKPFNYYGAPDATEILVAMGSVCETIDETIDYLVSKGEKVGLVKLRQQDICFTLRDRTLELQILDRHRRIAAVNRDSNLLRIV
mgnify:CR=1 FL=1